MGKAIVHGLSQTIHHRKFRHIKPNPYDNSRDCRAIFDYFNNNLGKIVKITDKPNLLLLDTIDAHVYP